MTEIYLITRTDDEHRITMTDVIGVSAKKREAIDMYQQAKSENPEDVHSLWKVDSGAMSVDGTIFDLAQKICSSNKQQEVLA